MKSVGGKGEGEESIGQSLEEHKEEQGRNSVNIARMT